MPFLEHTLSLMQQLHLLLQQLEPARYSEPLPALQGSSIGAHLRHIIEFFEELDKGYHLGLVNYDARQRNSLLETDPALASERLLALPSLLQKEDRPLQLVLTYGQEAPVTIATSYYREWAFAIEHTVHHMAQIKTGLSAEAIEALPQGFGIALSTQRMRGLCAP
jgi:uncharacterized damage-inducible protein DinB